MQGSIWEVSKLDMQSKWYLFCSEYWVCCQETWDCNIGIYGHGNARLQPYQAHWCKHSIKSWFYVCLLNCIQYDRRASKDLTKLMYILVKMNFIECATTCCRRSGLLGRKDTRSALRTQLCGVWEFMLQSLGRPVCEWQKSVMPYGIIFTRCTETHKT